MGPGPDPKLRLNSCGGGCLRCSARPCADLFALVARSVEGGPETSLPVRLLVKLSEG